MAKLNWYNENSGRAFPFVFTPVIDIAVLPVPEPTIVDAGFIIGDATALHGNTPVELVQISRTGSTLYFQFSFGLFSFRFERAVNAARGMTDFVEAYRTEDGPGASNPRYGSAFMVTGALSHLANIVEDGDVLDVSNGRIEPALVQSEYLRQVHSLSFANDGDVYIPSCEDPEPAPEIETFPVPGLEGLTGDIEIMLGFNCSATVNNTANSILLSATKGVNNGLAEAGPCSDSVRTPGNPPPAACQCQGLIFTINELGPDTGGNVQAQGDMGIQVFPEGHKLVVLLDGNAALRGCS